MTLRGQTIEENVHRKSIAMLQKGEEPDERTLGDVVSEEQKRLDEENERQEAAPEEGVVQQVRCADVQGHPRVCACVCVRVCVCVRYVYWSIGIDVCVCVFQAEDFVPEALRASLAQDSETAAEPRRASKLFIPKQGKVCVRACVRACVCACVRVRVCVHVFLF